MKLSSSKFVMVIHWKKIECSVWSRSNMCLKREEFSDLEIYFTSDERTEQEIEMD